MRALRRALPSVRQPTLRHTRFASTQAECFSKLGWDQRSLYIDQAKIEDRYRALQMEVHPDRAGDDGAESAALAAAMRALRSPFKRAVLALRTRTGVDALGDDRRMEDQALMMLLMELNETVEDGTLDEVRALVDENATALRACEERVVDLLDDSDQAVPVLEEWKARLQIQERAEQRVADS